MSLKIYINTEIQDFEKKGSGDLLGGLQKSKTFRLLPIYGAYSNVSNAISKIELVKINQSGKEIERQIISNSLIKYESGQYLIDFLQDLGTISEGLYFLEFSNDNDIFKSEVFLIEKMNIKLTADLTVITADNNLIKVNDTNITI